MRRPPVAQCRAPSTPAGRCSAASDSRRRAITHAVAPFDARIDRGLRDIDQEVEDHEEQRQHQDRACNSGQVALGKIAELEQQSGTGQENTSRSGSSRRACSPIAGPSPPAPWARLLMTWRIRWFSRKPLGRAPRRNPGQDIAGQRAHRARDDAHRNHRRRDRGQIR